MRIVMKNHILFIAMLFISLPSISQKNKIVGKWIIVKETQSRDTVNSQSDFIKEPWDDYNTNKKVLDTRYIDQREDLIENEQNWILIIKREKDYFRGKVEKKLNRKIVYDIANENYWTIVNDSNGTEKKMILKLNKKNNRLLVIDDNLKYIVSEYKRKK